MNLLTRVFLVVMIIVVALIGIGFGLCGVVGLTAGLRSGAGTNLLVLACSIGGIGIAVGAVLLIRATLWKALKSVGEDEE
jgi:hypothetical protein